MPEINVKNGRAEQFRRTVALSKNIKSRQTAITLFNILLGQPDYRTKSVDCLVSLYLKSGDYLQAREVLRTYGDESNLFSLAKLEDAESNYKAAEEYYRNMNNTIIDQRVKLALARIELQLGKYKQGRDILDELKEDERYIFHAIFEKCLSYILEQDYEKAYNILQQLKTDKMVGEQLEDYKSLNVYLSYFLGRMDEQDLQDSSKQSYWSFRLLYDSDNVLLKHISYHLERNDEVLGYFKSFNLKKLLGEVREIIPNLNPRHFNLTDYYTIQMDRTIGCVGGIETKSLCAINVLGTDKILTMYPVLLSDEFDREGNRTSEELRRKRELSRKD